MEINAIGLACPKPVILAKKHLKEYPDEALKIYVDNEIATQNLQKLAKQLDLNTTIMKLEEEKYLVTFVRDVENQMSSTTGMKPDKNERAYIPVQSRKLNRKEIEGLQLKEGECSDVDFAQEYVVIISSDEMGSGESDFSKMLLEGFVYSLTEQDYLPKYIVCYNRGVFLSASNQNTIRDFKTLEKKGVEIISCGLCLDRYELKEQLQAGSVTNMYRICEIMSKYRSVSPC